MTRKRSAALVGQSGHVRREPSQGRRACYQPGVRTHISDTLHGATVLKVPSTS